MKRLILKASIVILVCFIGASCEKDFQDETSVTTKNVRAKGEAYYVKDGRLNFVSREAFKDVYQKFADADEETLAEFMDPLYNQGFVSLRPVVTEKNEEFLFSVYDKVIQADKTYEEKFDVLDRYESIVGDDTFGAFINYDGEVVIADEVYKYTDVGLFISKIDSYTDLTKTLLSNNISVSPAVQTPPASVDRFMAIVPCNQIMQLSQETSYVATNNNCGGSSGSGGSGTSTPPASGSNTPTTGSPASSDPSYAAFLNNLGSCDPHSGIFGTLLGDNNVCIDKYEKRRRVKTKAFNYNYYAVYHMGVKCVHQYRGWTGFWRVEQTDEIRLVVEAAQFEYNTNQLLNNALVNNYNIEKDYYTNNQKIHYGPNSMNINGYTYSNLTSLPPIFQDDLTFEFFSTGWNQLDVLIQNGINSNLNAKKLNEYFYGQLYSTVKSNLTTALGQPGYTPPSNRTFISKFPENGKVIIQKSVLNKGFNIGVREKTFDWGAEFSWSASNNGYSWSNSVGAGTQLIRPRNFRVKIIGAARHGSGWHGSKFNVGID